MFGDIIVHSAIAGCFSLLAVVVTLLVTSSSTAQTPFRPQGAGRFLPMLRPYPTKILNSDGMMNENVPLVGFDVPRYRMTPVRIGPPRSAQFDSKGVNRDKELTLACPNLEVLTVTEDWGCFHRISVISSDGQQKHYTSTKKLVLIR